MISFTNRKLRTHCNSDTRICQTTCVKKDGTWKCMHDDDSDYSVKDRMKALAGIKPIYIEYSQDYSAHYTNRSIVDKHYFENNLVSA